MTTANTFNQGQSVSIAMRNGKQVAGTVVRLPGQDYDNGTKQLGPDEYRCRTGSAPAWAHLTVNVSRLSPRD